MKPAVQTTSTAIIDRPDSQVALHARGIIDFSVEKLADRPDLLEEKLRRTSGVNGVEINVFSNKITVDFDPSITSLDKIRNLLKKRKGS